jgi:hypothetical protein
MRGLLILSASLICNGQAQAINSSGLGINPKKSSSLGRSLDCIMPHPSAAGRTLDQQQLEASFLGAHKVSYKISQITISGPTQDLTITLHKAKPVAPIASKFGEITYHAPWPGVDVVYETGGSKIAKSNYLLAPGFTSATIEQIVLDYHQPVRLNAHGQLVIAHPGGEFVESAPIAWQEVGGEKRWVQAQFQFRDKTRVGFRIQAASSAYPLIIDPSISWNTFMGRGESNSDYANDILVDTSGNSYISGYSDGKWPYGGSPLRGYSDAQDVYVAKVDNSGNLAWVTFLVCCNSNGFTMVDFG